MNVEPTATPFTGFQHEMGVPNKPTDPAALVVLQAQIEESYGLDWRPKSGPVIQSWYYYSEPIKAGPTTFI